MIHHLYEQDRLVTWNYFQVFTQQCRYLSIGRIHFYKGSCKQNIQLRIITVVTYPEIRRAHAQ